MTASPGRIDRPVVPRSTTLERKVDSRAAEAVASAKAVVADLTEAASDFARQQVAATSLGTATVGGHVSRSASPDALWSSAPPAPKEAEALGKLSHGEKVEKLKELKAEKAELSTKIEDRVAVLDQKWDRSRSKTQAAALKAYLADGGAKLDPAARADLEAKLATFDQTQASFDVAMAKAKALPPSKDATPEVRAQRSEMAHQLLAMHRSMREIAEAASGVVDSCGAKVDRLAGGEQVIDPNAPPKGSPQCLQGMVTHFFELTATIFFLERSIKTDSPVLQQLQQDGKDEAALNDRLTSLREEHFKKLQVRKDDVEKSDKRSLDDALLRARAEAALIRKP